MPDRVEHASWNGKANFPLCVMLDTARLGQSGSLLNGTLRVGNFIENVGMRRYRLHCIQLTGAGPTRIRVLDLPFLPTAATSWENAVIAAAQATATRFSYNFGEGTAVLTNMMGPYLAVELQNNGADSATYEVELWMQV